VRCPRCQRASPDDAVFCPGCGAPLAFRAEPSPRRLDRSISLDRRAAGREALLDPSLEGAGSAAWDLAPALAEATSRHAPLPPIGAGDDLESGPAPFRHAPFPGIEADDLEFGPIPELAPELEPGPAPALAMRDAPDPEAFEPVRASAPRPQALAEPGAWALSGPEGFDEEPAAPGATAPGEDRPFSRALGLAPDPVVPDDLGLVPEDEPGGPGEPGALELPPRAGGEPLAAGLARELDLGLALEGHLEPGEDRELDLALPASARSAQLPLPLRETKPRLRPARPARRAAAWAVDAAPLALLWLGALAALYDRVPLSPGDRAGLIERMLRDGGALALPLLAGVATLALVHQTLAHALAGATLGKRLLGLRVVSDDGERPSVERCAARAALSAASVLLLGLGLLPALFTGSGRALHDISAGTRVVEAP
jgi:uncharacterized RDD family membrane protein YckC